MLPIYSPGQALAGAFLATQAVSAAGSAVAETGNFLSQLTSKVTQKSTEEISSETNQVDPSLLPQEVSLSKMSDLDLDVTDLRKSVAGQLHQLFSKNGIDVGSGIDLHVDQLGQVRVQGDHPDKAFIETLLAGDQGLSNNFKELSAKESLINTVKEAYEFQKAYSKDPAKAVQDYSHLFDQDHEENVSFRLGKDFFNVAFS